MHLSNDNFLSSSLHFCSGVARDYCAPGGELWNWRPSLVF